ncbi:MAG TPA: phosphatase PAP2 family protein [Chthoniobacterales bacterium]|nr:phosphatase PAP2 family protein [Chthoniobacterales bacterium]
MRRIAALRWWGLFILSAGLLLLASFYFDAGAQAWIAQHQSAALKKFMRGVSRLGDWPGHISLGLILLVLAYWRRSKKWMQIAAAMILACALAGAVARVVKISTGRARPSVQTEAAWSGPNFEARYNAFPSGHTAASTAFFGTLALACWRIGVPFLAIPILIAFSRMYIGAHHLSDVVCAAVIGMLAAYFVARWIPPAIRNPESEIRN